MTYETYFYVQSEIREGNKLEFSKCQEKKVFLLTKIFRLNKVAHQIFIELIAFTFIFKELKEGGKCSNQLQMIC